jgi:putative copper resistance protein D
MDALAVWTWAPVPLVLGAALASAYVAGVVRLRSRGERWAPWRTGLFLGAGIGGLVLATCWWPGARAHEVFAAYMTMVMALALVVPALLVLGAPVRLGREALVGTRAGRWWNAGFDSRPLRGLTHPLVTPLLMLVLPCLVVFTPLLLATLQGPSTLAATQVVLVVLGMVALLGLVDGQVPDHGLPHALIAFVAFFELILDAFPGIVLYFTTSLVAGGWYAVHGDPGGTSWAQVDQQTAAAILWGVGEAIDIPFHIVIMVIWMRADAAEGRRMDALLDDEEEQERAVQAHLASRGQRHPDVPA